MNRYTSENTYWFGCRLRQVAQLALYVAFVRFKGCDGVYSATWNMMIVCSVQGVRENRSGVG